MPLCYAGGLASYISTRINLVWTLASIAAVDRRQEYRKGLDSARHPVPRLGAYGALSQSLLRS